MLGVIEKGLALLPPLARRRWAGLVALAVISAAVEALAAVLVLSLIRLINAPDEAAQIGAVRVLQPILPADTQGRLLAFSLVVAGAYLFKNLLLAGAAFAQSRVAADEMAALAKRLMERYLAAPYRFHLESGSAALITRMAHSVERVHAVLMQASISALSESLIVAGIAAVLLSAAPLPALLAILIVGLLVMVALRATRGVFQRWGADEQRLHRELIQTLQHALGGIKEVKVLGREAFFLRRYAEQHDGLARVRRYQGTVSTLPRLLIETVFVVGLALVVAVVMALAGPTRQVIPLLGLFAYGGFRIIPSLNRILMHVAVVRHASAAMDEIHQDLSALTSLPVEEAGDVRRLPLERNIAFRGVRYRYRDATARALDGVEFEIPRGASVGIVGPSGAGKTTLINVLLGLLAPEDGTITVDGVDIQSNLRAWRKLVGYVPQDPFLLDDTLRSNVAFGVPAAEINGERLQRAVRSAQLDDVVAGLPRGLETVVGERGVRLSGGQRQRVAIARALYGDPEVLVFDEATSSLDNRTELEVTRAVAALRGQKTLVVVAHRLSTVRGCDRIIFLNGGRVEAVDRFDVLMEGNAAFRQMAALER